MVIKEFVQLRRDRLTFGTMIFIPVVQLLLFGYAINTNPRHLPTAVLLQEQTDVARSILKAVENTKYFDVTHVISKEAEFDRLLASGKVTAPEPIIYPIEPAAAGAANDLDSTERCQSCPHPLCILRHGKRTGLDKNPPRACSRNSRRRVKRGCGAFSQNVFHGPYYNINFVLKSGWASLGD